MARRLKLPVGTPEAVVAVLGGVVAAVVVVTGVALVAARRIDPVEAAMLGGLALVAAETGAAAGRALWVPSVGPGTHWARMGVVGAAMAGGLVVAVVVGPHARPSGGSVVVGGVAVGLLVVVVGVAAGRPWPRSPARRFPDPGKVLPGPLVTIDTDTSRIE